VFGVLVVVLRRNDIPRPSFLLVHFFWGSFDLAVTRFSVPRDNQGENRATIRMRKAPGMG
jgi:hypothetical protein